MKRFTLTATSLLLTASLSFGQNARVRAMGGSFLIDDISTILLTPADMNGYKDQVQASLAGEVSASTVIGVKSLGNALSVGAYYDGDRVLNSAAYSFLAGTVLDNVSSGAFGDGGDLEEADVTPIPHILLGIDANALSLGLDLFLERARVRGKEENDNSGTITTSTLSSTFLHPGFLAGLSLNAGSMGIAAILGGSLPIARGEYSVESESGTDTETASGTGPHLTAGIEAILDISDADITVGGVFDLFNYTGSSEDADGNTDDEDKNSYKMLEVYGGIEKNIPSADLDFNALADVIFSNTASEPAEIEAGNADPGREATNSLSWTLRAGVEKTWDNLQRIDQIAARCGISYGENVINVDHENGEAGGVSHDYRLRNATTRTGFGGYIGTGISKGPFTFDALVNPVNWVAPVMMTVTINFSGASGGFSTSPSESPSYSPEPDLGF